MTQWTTQKNIGIGAKSDITLHKQKSAAWSGLGISFEAGSVGLIASYKRTIGSNTGVATKASGEIGDDR